MKLGGEKLLALLASSQVPCELLALVFFLCTFTKLLKVNVKIPENHK